MPANASRSACACFLPLKLRPELYELSCTKNRKKDVERISNVRGRRGGSRMYLRGRTKWAKGWFLTPNVAPPRQEATEERHFSPKARVRAGKRHPARRGATKKTREGVTRVERTAAEREGSGKAGRPGIDRLKKGWIFLPLGGGPV